MSVPTGLFISFEGIDGAGKSSHLEPLAALFRAQGRTVRLTREPGGTPVGEALRGLMLGESMDAMTEALLVFAARREHLRQVILPALAAGEVVLCDRFTDATFAYQGQGRGVPIDALKSLERLVQQQPDGTVLQPNLCFWFDLEPAQAAARVQQARQPDRFEAESGLFFERVAAGYRDRMAAAPHRFARIDASLSRHQVWQQLTSAVVRRGWLAIMVAAAPSGLRT